MKLNYKPGLPVIKFNNKAVFKGKSALIKLLKSSGMTLRLGQYDFSGDVFNVDEAINLFKEII